jgi:hypothetical protein
MGSPYIAGLIAHAAFWALLAVGWTELGPRRAAVFVALWIAGRVASPYVASGLLFTPYVAVLDIALVFIVYYGEARLQ